MATPVTSIQSLQHRKGFVNSEEAAGPYHNLQKEPSGLSNQGYYDQQGSGNYNSGGHMNRGPQFYANADKGYTGVPGTYPAHAYPQENLGTYTVNPEKTSSMDYYVDEYGTTRKRPSRGARLAALLAVCWCCTWPCHGPCCGGF